MHEQKEIDSKNPAAHVIDLSEIMNSIIKPLHFASKNDFQHLNSVKGIERLMRRLCDETLPLGLSKEFRSRFKELQDLFTEFDSHDIVIKKKKIQKAFDIVNSITENKIKTPLRIPLHEVDRRLADMNTPLQFVKGIGPKLSERLKKKGLETVGDMLYFLPIKYEDRRNLKKIRELVPGATETITGEILAIGESYYGRKKVFEMAVGDGSGVLKIKWFNYRLPYMKNRYKNGQRLLVFGLVSSYGAQKFMIHPDIELIDMQEGMDDKELKGIVPVYSQIENFHQKTIRKLIKGVVSSYADSALSGVPAEICTRLGLMELKEAIKETHFPSDPTQAVRLAKKSVAFDELFVLELGLAMKRSQNKKESGISFAGSDGRLEEMLRGNLPFTMTGAQERTLKEIKADMDSPHPMNRLIQGDVGSGKTVVSFIAALRAIEAGYQAALMAPTEILSEQHYLSIHKHAEKLGIKIVLLTGSMTKAIKDRSLKVIREGQAGLVIGTHALIQKDVEFKKLGLIIIDEQHRFGVMQRAELKKRGVGADKDIFPDLLIMTATPIPRTLSMTVFGDLDVSIIDELPPGRKPVYTKVIREKDRLKAYEAIRKEIESGGQCYIVYPLVEESEELSLKDATNMKEHLQKSVFKEFKLGLLHGRMKATEKESVMEDFKERRLEILVSTTVIEVGVDVPNASLMLIEHAERFGLAQLHQLRGRVGRGERRSTCLLLAAWTNSEDTYRRLSVMEETMDGFKIAEEDLKIRGPGDFLGTRQAGLPDFRTTEVLADLTLLKKAREEALSFLERNQGRDDAEYACTRKILKARWDSKLELAEIG